MRHWHDHGTDGTTAVLFQTHFFDRRCARAFAALARGCAADHRPVVVIHLPPGAPVPPRLGDVPHHVVRTDEMRLADYGAKAHGPAWSLWNGGHTDLIFLHYARAHPGHARYWAVEYDVRFSGDWRRFFAAYEDDPADLLAPAILPRSADPGWYNWHSLAGPAPDEALQLRAFLPVFRASARLVQAVDAAYRGGLTGHCEAIWPSIAQAAGMSIHDLGGDGPFTPDRYRGRFYSSSPLSPDLCPGSFAFKPPLYRPGSRRDMLWHPVKPFFWRVEAKEGLRDMRRRAGILLRRAATLAGFTLPPLLQEGGFETLRVRRRSQRCMKASVAENSLQTGGSEAGATHTDA
jgi:hypothetical protein